MMCIGNKSTVHSWQTRKIILSLTLLHRWRFRAAQTWRDVLWHLNKGKITILPTGWFNRPISFGYMGYFVWFQTQSLFVDAFLHNNRLENLIQMMGYHPRYLDCFLKTQQYILRGDGPLPFDYRHYIAIMVSNSLRLPFFPRKIHNKIFFHSVMFN